MQPFLPFMEVAIKKYYDTLNEKDKRLYSAIEALKLGRGGISYISEIVNCTRKTVSKGISELLNSECSDVKNSMIRIPGGGRKPYYELVKDIDEKFLSVLDEYTAGDPMKEDVRWTNLTVQEITTKLSEHYGIRFSEFVIRQLLKKHNYKRRKAQKTKTAKTVENRNEQFENISRHKHNYLDTENPIISIDTKKKEPIGNFFREGLLYTQGTISVNDHDFISLARGFVVPHGIYDLKKNLGFINLGASKDTSEFACDSIKNWWFKQGQFDYPTANSILILCDSGGSNHCRHYIFKEQLQKLSNDIGKKIRIAHYPPYTSKYNPIEHRLFPFITKACKGMIFKSVELVKELMEKTKTSTGLKVIVDIIDKVYQTGIQVSEEFKHNMKIAFDNFLPQWNYCVFPDSFRRNG